MAYSRLRVTFLSGLFILIFGVSTVYAQCADFVQQALGLMAQNCATIPQNGACYGYNGVSASFAVPVAADFFTRPSDIAQIEQMSRLATLPYDPATGIWGIAVIKAQANIPATLPGQAVTMILLGDVNLQNAADGMQSFIVQTGIGQPSCSQIPPSSLTVQGPRNVHVNLNVNGADFSIGSTVNFRANDNGELRVSTLDGRVTTGNGIVILAGFSRSAEVDDQGMIIEESWSEEEIITEEEMFILESFEDLPEEILGYEIDVPDLDELAMLDALDFDLIGSMDPYLLAALIDDFVASGLDSSELNSFTLDDLEAYLQDNLDYFDVDEAFFAAMAESFSFSDDELAYFADEYGLDPGLIEANLNDDYDAMFEADSDELIGEDTGSDDDTALEGEDEFAESDGGEEEEPSAETEPEVIVEEGEGGD
ncbi:MAG: hypothetical protein IAE89_01470 [Anaerolineae bacterium]|nr:hypothetical protein [Anaerolineae bacterium]